MSYGIDHEIQQTADAYRGKPEMLQKKYAMDKQLIDLLAMQKLKSDKDEAARQLAMQSNGGMQTTGDKLKNDLLDDAKKEVVKDFPGVAQHEMQQTQDAQKKLLQAAGAPQQGAPQQGLPQQNMQSAGLATLPADNIAPKMMAGGGIVAFSGESGNQQVVDESRAGEAEARQYMEEQRQRAEREAQPREQPRAVSGGGLPAALAALHAIRPEEIYKNRNEEAARAANLNPEERAAKERHIAERQAFDDRNAFANALIAGAGYTNQASGIANMGQAAARNARNSMLQRIAGENELVDMGPESRKAGIKAGEAGYTHAMPGLYHGVQASVDLEKAAQMGAATRENALERMQRAKDALDAKIEATANENERKKLVNARDAADKNPTVALYMKEILANGLGADAPENARKMRDVERITRQIYESRGFNPDLFVPPAPAVVTPPPKPPGVFERVFGGGSSKVDTSNPLLRGK